MIDVNIYSFYRKISSHLQRDGFPLAAIYILNLFWVVFYIGAYGILYNPILHYSFKKILNSLYKWLMTTPKSSYFLFHSM